MQNMVKIGNSEVIQQLVSKPKAIFEGYHEDRIPCPAVSDRVFGTPVRTRFYFGVQVKNMILTAGNKPLHHLQHCLNLADPMENTGCCSVRNFDGCNRCCGFEFLFDIGL